MGSWFSPITRQDGINKLSMTVSVKEPLPPVAPASSPPSSSSEIRTKVKKIRKMRILIIIIITMMMMMIMIMIIIRINPKRKSNIQSGYVANLVGNIPF